MMISIVSALLSVAGIVWCIRDDRNTLLKNDMLVEAAVIDIEEMIVTLDYLTQHLSEEII